MARRNSKQRKIIQNIRERVAYSKLIKQTTKLPDSTSQRIIIPSNEHGTGFMRNGYIPEYLEHLLSEE